MYPSLVVILVINSHLIRVKFVELKKKSRFWGSDLLKLCAAVVPAVSSTPRHFAALIPVGYYCPSGSRWAVLLCGAFIEAEICATNKYLSNKRI